MSSETKELKSCPFCGGRAEIHNCMEFENEVVALKYTGKVGVHCTECHIATIPYDTIKEAAEVWNQRANEKNHGMWKWLTPKEAKKYAALGIVTSDENWICSECHNHKTFIPRHRPDYCDKCGAKMDGGQK